VDIVHGPSDAANSRGRRLESQKSERRKG
jgi:hypothetical protein